MLGILLGILLLSLPLILVVGGVDHGLRPALKGAAFVLVPFLLAALLRLRSWHGAEHKVVEALLLMEKGFPLEEAWRKARYLSPWCGTVLAGMMLPLFTLALIWEPLAFLAPPIALFMHLRLSESSPFRKPGLLFQRLFVAPPSPLQEERALAGLRLLQEEGWLQGNEPGPKRNEPSKAGENWGPRG